MEGMSWYQNSTSWPRYELV